MADEAFALSPISARAAPPSEADFDAIREAFMETSRGRWFLAEYAKRNRNADTAMVLDAVARIEQTVAAQQQAAPDDALPKALAAIRNSLAEARAAAAAALDKRMDDALGPIEKGVRIIREISWRWREIGGDSRICDLLDSQAGAIDKVHAQLAARNDATALHAAFGLIEAALDQPWDSLATTVSSSPAETASSSPTTGDDTLVSPEETVSPERAVVDTVVGEPEAAAATLPEAQVDSVHNAAATSHDEHAPASAVDEQDMAHDDAVLDMIALEMGAPDFDEAETAHPDIGAPAIAEPEPAIEPIADGSDVHIDPEPEPIPEVAAPPSLGASLLASGIVPRAAPRSDPLAPIRRMTQAEKIAFFS